MKHILGMTKSCLDLRGSNAPKLECDFLRILLAVNTFENSKTRARGYLLVMNEKIFNRVKSWCSKYDTKDKIQVVVIDARADELKCLSSEKVRNRRGMIDRCQGRPASKDSVAEFGKSLGEGYLAELISKREPGVKRIFDKSKFPLSVNWDFYGIQN